MRYSGRVAGVIILLALRAEWAFYYHFIKGLQSISIFELTMTFLLIVPAWFIGKQYDKVKYFSKQLTISNKKLEETEGRFRSLVENSLTCIYTINKEMEFSYVNPAFAQVFGYSNDELIGKKVHELIAKEEHYKVIDHLQNCLNNNEKSIYFQFKGINKNNQTKLIKAHGSIILDNQTPSIIGSLIDITENHQAIKKINFLSFYDSLSGLPNKHQFNQNLNEAVYKYNNLSVLYLDLDRFKSINDTLGYEIGDGLLKNVATRLVESSILNKNEAIFRYGGDEFLVLLVERSKNEVAKVAKLIIDLLSKPFQIDENKIYTSASIGVSTYPDDTKDKEDLIKFANIAMYQVKEKGKNNFYFFTKDLDQMLSRKVLLENELHNALENNELLVYYQPKIDLSTTTINGVEALVRWKHPKLGFISPVEFIPIAEETGLINQIGAYVLETACKQHKIWQAKNSQQLTLAVNVSTYQLNVGEYFIETLKQILAETKLDPSCLEIEITESFLQDIDFSRQILYQVKELGIKISIDDFGTGYSSLSYLKNFPVDQIKIDKSFIDEINQTKDGETIIKTIIHMGHNLGLEIVSEGIETIQQYNFLKDYNCHIGQGFYFSKPLPPKDLEELLTMVPSK